MRAVLNLSGMKHVVVWVLFLALFGAGIDFSSLIQTGPFSSSLGSFFVLVAVLVTLAGSMTALSQWRQVKTRMFSFGLSLLATFASAVHLSFQRPPVTCFGGVSWSGFPFPWYPVFSPPQLPSGWLPACPFYIPPPYLLISIVFFLVDIAFYLAPISFLLKALQARQSLSNQTLCETHESRSRPQTPKS